MHLLVIVEVGLLSSRAQNTVGMVLQPPPELLKPEGCSCLHAHAHRILQYSVCCPISPARCEYRFALVRSQQKKNGPQSSASHPPRTRSMLRAPRPAEA